jgi:hypothetical protein
MKWNFSKTELFGISRQASQCSEYAIEVRFSAGTKIFCRGHEAVLGPTQPLILIYVKFVPVLN